MNIFKALRDIREKVQLALPACTNHTVEMRVDGGAFFLFRLSARYGRELVNCDFAITEREVVLSSMDVLRYQVEKAVREMQALLGKVAA